MNKLFKGRIEYHAFFDGNRLAEYLFNLLDIHSGFYTSSDSFSNNPIPRIRVSAFMAGKYPVNGDAFVMSSKAKRKKRPNQVSNRLITAVEQRDFSDVGRRKITPEQLRKLLSLCDEIGAMGEQAVLAYERKRLAKLGFDDQAKQVERISLHSVGEGFDIISFEDDGVTKRYLEVKTTISDSLVVNMSRGEWKAAQKHGEHYYLARVIRARDARKLFLLKNPCKLEEKKKVTRTSIGWTVDLSTAASFVSPIAI